jgi:hypothetical protein
LSVWILSSPTKRISAIVGALGLGLLALSFARYFIQDDRTILTIIHYYEWSAQPDGAAKSSRLVTVDVDCVKPIFAAAYAQWRATHVNEVAAAAPFPPLGGPLFVPQTDTRVIEGEPSNGWRDLGFSGEMNKEALGEVRSNCLRYTPIYAHPSSVEFRSDLGRWTSHAEPRPIIGFGLAVIGVLGLSGLLDACFQWIIRGQFRPPN